ncbi:ACP S-malonyltransferase [Paenibacillus tepidiphilus]|uniref:ACP S-malonyltransferase n=1 Tax=Paenibacillus tepidiphilus TaxID=2608683 RepID=UPI001EF15E5B|nr:ACP S-malonyltransferase [Paenibacillus tepidiphilus]
MVALSKLGLLFPGQGSQYTGMGKDLYDSFQTARDTFDEACDVLGFDLKALCFDGDMEQLSRTSNAQPAILTASVAAFRVLMQEIKPAPAYAAGHSLGEFTALACSGALSFADAVALVRRRGELMEEAAGTAGGGMLAVTGVSEEILADICVKASSIQSFVSIANYNSAEQIVISGHAEALDKAKGEIEKLGASTIPLKVSAPFHTAMMSKASEAFGQELRGYAYGRFKWPVIANLSGTPYADKRFIVSNLTQQMARPVQWYKSMQYLLNQDVSSFIEVGPRTVLTKLMKTISASSRVFSMEHASHLEELRKAELEARPDGLGLIVACIAAAVSTQNRNWDNGQYEQGVIMPYQRIQELRERLVKTGSEPSLEEMQFALTMLKSILNTKFTPLEEQEERFERMLYATNTQDLFPAFQVS